MNDLVVLNDQVTSRIEAYDYGVVDKQIYESRLQGFIGVSNDSSLIQALQRANAVSLRSYSFFWGGEIMDESRNGLVTFAGTMNPSSRAKRKSPSRSIELSPHVLKV